MTGHDDYLWDRDGEPDAEVRRLEELLGGFRHDGRELPLGELPAPEPATRRWPWLLAAAAAVAAAAFLLWPDDRLRKGSPQRTFVAERERLTVRLGELAELVLAPSSELRFEHWREDSALFSLQRGALTARVAPYPAVAADFFLVDTPLGRVTDKGCRYELRIESDGTHVVEVTEGAVTFTFPGRTVFVPAGAGTRVDEFGPRTPLFDDCSPELRKAMRELDALTIKGAGEIREKGLFAVTELCRTGRDSLPLWHLLRDDDELLRELAERALVDLVGEPPGEPLGKGPHWDPEVWLAYLRLGAWSEAR